MEEKAKYEELDALLEPNHSPGGRDRDKNTRDRSRWTAFAGVVGLNSMSQALNNLIERARIILAKRSFKQVLPHVCFEAPAHPIHKLNGSAILIIRVFFRRNVN